MSNFEVRPYRAGDEHAIVALFNATFGAAPGFAPRTLAEWRWTYADNPAGMRAWVALQDGELVAHYASQPHVTRVDGAPRVFAQIVDSMAHPAQRRNLSKSGPFVTAAEALLRETVGSDKDWVAYGSPTPEAWRVGRLLLAYELVRRQTALVRELGDATPRWPDGVARVERFDERAKRLYERCLGEWRASVQRDEAYLNWRTFASPTRRYRVIAANDTSGEHMGYAIAREVELPDGRFTIVCDWLVPRDELATADKLLEGLAFDARAHGSRGVVALMPSWSPWFAHLQERGFIVRASPYMMVSGGFNHPHYDTFWLRDHWWYQPLDTNSV